MDATNTKEPEPVRCPRCHQELFPRDVFTGGRHATVGGCPSCGGLWMRDSDLERLSEVVEPVLVEWRRLSPPEYQAVPLDCPECGSPVRMEKVTSARDARVVIDTCDRCGGVWLDGSELRAIQQDSLLALASSFLRSRPAAEPEPVNP